MGIKTLQLNKDVARKSCLKMHTKVESNTSIKVLPLLLSLLMYEFCFAGKCSSSKFGLRDANFPCKNIAIESTV